MTTSIPKQVLLREDGPREGFQMHPEVVSSEDKLRLIDALSETGVKSIEVTSFVRPDRVPQLADAEQVASGFSKHKGVRYRALYLNEKGFRRALACDKLDPEGYILLAASEAFLKKNNNQTLEQALETIPRWLALFAENNLQLERIMLSCAFGEHEEGRIQAKKTLSVCDKAIQRIKDGGGTVEEITFADTTGYANPEAVRRLVSEFKSKYAEIHAGLHLHDTRGTGMANVYAGLLEGVSRFDCSVGGMGGCPFAKGAAGNVATEDVAFLCEELGVATGVNLQAYVQCSILAQEILSTPLPGKLKQGGVILQTS